MFRKHYVSGIFDTKKKAILRLKNLRRGYYQFKKNKELYIFRHLKNLFNQEQFLFDKFFYNILCFFLKDFKKINLDLSLSQFIFQKSRQRRIHLDMIMNNVKKNKILQPLSLQYSKILENNNYKVSKISYLILWPIFCLFYWLVGNFIFIKIIFKSFINFFKSNTRSDLFFFNIDKSHIPFQKGSLKNRESYDLVSWFVNYYKLTNNKNIKIHHNNKNIHRKSLKSIDIEFSDDPWLHISSFKKLILFIFLGLFLSFLSLIFLIFLRFSPALMIGEIFMTISVANSNEDKISKKYLFHYSESVYRPIWTYLEKNKRFETICYFYTTYDVAKNTKSDEIGLEYDFGNISWQKILVWDETQKKKLLKYVRHDICDIDITVTGPIWFRDTSYSFSNNNKRIIIFDMEVNRKSIQFGFYDVAEYTDLYDNFNCVFLEDIFNTFKNDCEIVLKRKRGSDYSKTNYKNLIKKLQAKGLIVVDNHVSPFYLLKNCVGAISTPFTSANLYTSSKINNIYYDPISRIYENDPAARDIKIVSGIDDLKKYKKKFYE